MLKPSDFPVAYFSLEIALENSLKSYAGGLGILAGDLLRSATDLELPMVGISLLNDQGYFQQAIDSSGRQQAEPVTDYDFSKLEKLAPIVSVNIGQEPVKIRAWQYSFRRNTHIGPVILLDTNCPENSASARQLTRRLYSGDKFDRLKQKIILGRGGYKMLQALGYGNLQKLHLNEGHGVLAALELFLSSSQPDSDSRLAAVRQQGVFTTHTPVNEAINTYSVKEMLDYQPDFPVNLPGLVQEEQINMARVGLYFSGYSNAVSKSHQRVAQKMFPEYSIQAITNGVHAATWTAPEFQELYDEYLPGWRSSGQKFLQASLIPAEKLAAAHQGAKRRLLDYIYQKQKIELSPEIITLGLARRFTPYKRLDLLFFDLERLLALQKKAGPIQIICAGKAHPQDQSGQAAISRIQKIKRDYYDQLKLVFLEDYDLGQAQLITAGVDVLLNTPRPPFEASGTSGMKAAHNGVPQLSTLDGWWPEGYLAGKTGWTIGQGLSQADDPEIDAHDAASLYQLLEEEVLPLYYQQPGQWQELSREAIAHNASIFNTNRAMQQYWQEAYKLAAVK